MDPVPVPGHLRNSRVQFDPGRHFGASNLCSDRSGGGREPVAKVRRAGAGRPEQLDGTVRQISADLDPGDVQRPGRLPRDGREDLTGQGTLGHQGCYSPERGTMFYGQTTQFLSRSRIRDRDGHQRGEVRELRFRPRRKYVPGSPNPAT